MQGQQGASEGELGGGSEGGGGAAGGGALEARLGGAGAGPGKKMFNKLI